MRHIWIIRHAKSAEGHRGQNDHDRPLNKRGERDGGNMRAWLATRDHPAQWVWSSSAVRARRTAAFVASGFDATCVESPDLYLASAQSVLDVLQTTPDEISSVAVVAHNPGLTQLVNRLGPSHVTDNLVTFGTAVFVIRDSARQTSWTDLAFGCAELLSLHSPKTI